jgi:hypothetical protein
VWSLEASRSAQANPEYSERPITRRDSAELRT